MDALNDVQFGEVAAARTYTVPVWRYWTLFLLVVMATLSMVDKMMITVMLDPISSRYSLNDTQLGLLTRNFLLAVLFRRCRHPARHRRRPGQSAQHHRHLHHGVERGDRRLCGLTAGLPATALTLRFVVGAGEIRARRRLPSR